VDGYELKITEQIGYPDGHRGHTSCFIKLLIKLLWRWIWKRLTQLFVNSNIDHWRSVFVLTIKFQSNIYSVYYVCACFGNIYIIRIAL